MELINRQVLDLWNRYKPTIAVDAIEYDRELRRLLSTNLAEVGKDCISRQQAIDAVKKLSLGETDATRFAMRIGDYLERLPSAQPEIIRCKDCLIHGVCRFELGLGLDGYCSQAERRTDE